jgi:putative ABC transport system permease protein
LENKFFSGINILGLTIGIASIILISLYIQYEWSYDRFHKNGDNIYRISVLTQWEDREEKSSDFLEPVGPSLKRDYPQVKEFLRIRKPSGNYFYYQNKPVRLDKILHTDSTFFTMFSFKILAGDAKRALSESYSIVLTQSIAKQIDYSIHNGLLKLFINGHRV